MYISFLLETLATYCAEDCCNLLPQGTYFFPSATTSQSPVHFMDESGTIKIAQRRQGTGLQMATRPQK